MQSQPRRSLAQPMDRREMLRASLTTAILAFGSCPLEVFGFSAPAPGDTVIPFLDIQPVGRPMVRWDQINSWITPNEQVFAVSHYGMPAVDAAAWRLEVSGLVRRPRSLTLEEIRSRKRRDVIATLECSGNTSNPGFMGACANVRWTGTPLAPLLRECGLRNRAIETVFFGADEKVEKIRDKDYPQQFARSLGVQDALRDDVLLAYEMNGQPLNQDHGAPLRLVVPGWFGIAWIKWLTRIELLDRRFMSKYMARDYVTIRGEERNGKTLWRETSVGPIDIKSILARVVRKPNQKLQLHGVAWTDGTPLRSVEVRVDDGPWRPAVIDPSNSSRYGWKFWSLTADPLGPGTHTLVSRATDAEGRVQPAAEDDAIRLKRTYWEANQQYPRKIKL